MTTAAPTTNWELGQFAMVWKNEGYEHGHIETIDPTPGHPDDWTFRLLRNCQVMLVGDDGREIFCQVKDLEEGE